MAGVSYQVASLDGQETYPISGSIDRRFYDVLPDAAVTINFAQHNSLRLFYNTSTRAPSIGQLQNVVNNTNPLLLSAGNPNLKQSYDNSITLRYSFTNPGNYNSFFVFGSLDKQLDYIGNSTTVAQRDTVLTGGVAMPRGTQLTIPVNLDGYWTFRSALTYSVPFDLISSNLNLTPGYTFSRTPGMINSEINLASNSAINAGVSVSSNISEDVDFNLSYTENYNIAKNTLEPSLNSNYFNNTSSAKLNLLFLGGFVFRNELYNTTYNGLSTGYNQNYLLWNIALARKFFANDRGEIRLTVTDVLNQNANVGRSVTETYIEDTQNQVLGRYGLLMFTYTLK